MWHAVYCFCSVQCLKSLTNGLPTSETVFQYLLDYFWLQLVSPKIRSGSCQQCSKEQGIEWGLVFFLTNFLWLCSVNGNFCSALVVKWPSNSESLAFTLEFLITQFSLLLISTPYHPFSFPQSFLWLTFCSGSHSTVIFCMMYIIQKAILE